MASVCQQLTVGQKVSVRELEHGCELALASADQVAATVIELGVDFLILEDSTGDVRTRIPLYLVKAVGATSVPAPAPAEVVPTESAPIVESTPIVAPTPAVAPAPAVTTAA